MVKPLNTHKCCFLTHGASCTTTFGITQMSSEESHRAHGNNCRDTMSLDGCSVMCRGPLQVNLTADGLVSVSMGVMWSCQTAYIILKKLCRSLLVQNRSYECSSCAPGNVALSHDKEMTEEALEIFSSTVLIQTPFEVFLLISS